MSTPPSTVDIIETDSFKNEVDRHLSPHELGALRTYLANNPSAGIPSRDKPGLLYLEWGKQKPCMICYMVQGYGEVIFLVNIYGPGESAPITGEDQEGTVKMLLSRLKSVGIGILIKEAWEYIEDYFTKG